MRLILVLTIICLGALPALAHGDEDHDDDGAESVNVSGVAVPDDPTYHAHARPIIEANCVACHADGQIAGFAPLTETAVVLEVADDIAWHIRKRIMPPWMPSDRSPPLKRDRRLSESEIATIIAWAENGAPVGDEAAYQPPAATDGFDFVEVRADLVLQLDEAYTPPEDVQDDYRCFAFPLEVDAPQFVTGYEFIPDVTEMAHHNLVYLFDARAKRAIERRDYADGKPGWTCYGGAGLGGGGEGIAGWAPGALPLLYPEGTGFLITPGQHIVVQMHYNLSLTRQPDRSQIVLQLESAGSDLAELIEIPLAAPVEIPCPAGVEGPQCEREAAVERVSELFGRGNRDFPNWLLRECEQTLADYADNTGENAIGFCDFPVTWPLTIFGVSGHMHELGRSFHLELNPGEADARLLLDIPRWDFHWQGNYEFVEPLEVSVGDVLRMTCVWDNSRSDDPRYVVWGEGTADEMCFGTLLALKP